MTRPSPRTHNQSGTNLTRYQQNKSIEVEQLSTGSSTRRTITAIESVRKECGMRHPSLLLLIHVVLSMSIQTTVIGHGQRWRNGLNEVDWVDFFQNQFEQRLRFEANSNLAIAAVESIHSHDPNQRHSDQPDRYSYDPRLTRTQLDMILDTSGSVFESIGQAESSRMTLADLKFVKRIRAGDGEWWSAVYPLQKLPPTQPINAQLVEQAMRHQFTLVLNRMNYRYQPIADLCERLTKDLFGFRIQANLYLTPTNSTGFEAHFDWQEAIVLQLAGEKRWTMYEPPLIALPRMDQKFKPRSKQLEKLSKQTYLLQPGNWLYFPRGVIHEATTVESPNPNSGRKEFDILPDSSMHLTLGVEIDPLFTMQGLLHLFLDQMSHTDQVMAAQLLEPIPLCKCPLPSSSAESSATASHSSNLTYLDLFQWSIFDASSRTNESDAVIPHSSQFRRSLWGIHFWNETNWTTLRTSPSEIPLPPTNETYASLLLEPSVRSTSIPTPSHLEWSHLDFDSRRTLAVHFHLARRLLHSLDSIESSQFSLVNSLPSLAQFQSRLRTKNESTSSTSTTKSAPSSIDPVQFTSASNPSQSQYEFEQLFQDRALLPFIQSALDDATLIPLLSLQHDPCVAKYFRDLQVLLQSIWRRWMKPMQNDLKQLFDRVPIMPNEHPSPPPSTVPLSSSTSTDTPITRLSRWSHSFDCLTPVLATIQSALFTSRSQHLATQLEYVRENTRRQQAYRTGQRAAVLKATHRIDPSHQRPHSTTSLSDSSKHQQLKKKATAQKQPDDSSTPIKPSHSLKDEL